MGIQREIIETRPLSRYEEDETDELLLVVNSDDEEWFKSDEETDETEINNFLGWDDIAF
jgi:hypothetical protein